MTREQIVEKLRDALAKDKRNATQIGAELGWHPGSVRNFKCGSKGLGVDEMVSLAKVLGFRIDWQLVKQ